MKICWFLITYLLCEINCIKSIENTPDIVKYLREKAKFVDEKLYRYSRSIKNSYNVKFNELSKTEINETYHYGEIFTFFDTPYVLINRKIFEISGDNSTLLQSFETNEKIIFSKAVNFKDNGFLALATKSNIIHIFGFEKNTKHFYKIQNIQADATDLVFFTCQDKLYLIVANFKSGEIMSITFYKFTDTHFDKISEFSTTNVTKLLTFNDNDREIIVALHQFEASSFVYEFVDDKVIKLHKIVTKNSEKLFTYTIMDKRFVAFIDKKGSIRVYIWTGFNMIFWEEFNTELESTAKLSAYYFNNYPYFLIPKEKKILIFSLTDTSFLLIKIVTTNWRNIKNLEFIYSKKKLIVIDITEKNVKVEMASFSLEVNPIEVNSNLVEDKKLFDCFLELEKSVYSLRNNLTKIENKTLFLREASEKILQDDFLRKNFNLLHKKYTSKKIWLENLENKKLIMNETAVLDIPNGAKKVWANDIHFRKINKKKFQPDRWLSYDGFQTISGKVKVNYIQADQLKTPANNSLLNDCLLSKGNQIFSGLVKVKSLEANKTELKFVNNVNLDNLYYKSDKTVIQGMKTFPQIGVKIINKMNDKIFAAFGSFEQIIQKISTNLTIKNLIVEDINEVNFDVFKNSVYQIGSGESIHGDIIFAQIEVNEMIFDTISRKANILTTSTNQEVLSSINITSIFANNIKTNKINQINFKQSVATFNDSLIKGPINIRNLNLTNNLKLKEDIDDEFLIINDTHLVGTNETDFLQRYNGKVIIKGNLILKNLDLWKNHKLFIKNKKYDLNMNNYWFKQKSQKIPTHFEAKNGVFTPHIFATFLNSVEVNNNYLLNSTVQEKTAKFYYDNVIIKGNVSLNPLKQHSPNFKQIENESVKVNGTFRIKGHKIYKILKVDTLEVNSLNNDSNIEQYFSRSGSNHNQNLFVKGDLKSKNLVVDYINNNELQKLMENSVFVDRDEDILQRLNFENVTVQNLSISFKINKEDVGKFIAKINKRSENYQIDNVFVHNDVYIKNVENLSSINNKNLSLVYNSSLIVNSSIYEPITFRGKIKVKNFNVLIANNVNLQKLTRKILYRQWNQKINSYYTFTKLKSGNLIVEQINNVSLNNLVDISSHKPQHLTVEKKLKMEQFIRLKNLHGKLNCDLNQNIRNLQNPLSQFWKNMIITGDVSFWDNDSSVAKIFNNVVTTADNKTNIKNHVKFINHLLVRNLTVERTINHINLNEIINDAVLNRPNINQIIKGKKRFLQMKADEVNVLHNTEVETINEINITKVNDNIVLKDANFDISLTGQKVFFGGLQTKTLQTDVISGVEAKNFVSSDSIIKIPQAIFQSIDVLNNFNITFVNRMPFDVFLEERFLKQSPKQIVEKNCFFQNIEIYGNVTTPKINDIKSENIVFDDDIQMIVSQKNFINNLKVIGNVKVDFINGLEISEFNSKSVFTNEDTNFTSAVQFLKPTLIKGNIQTKFINNFPLEYIIQASTTQSIQTEAEPIYEIIDTISTFIEKYLNASKKIPTELLYLEKIKSLQISLPNVVNANAVKTKNDILIHVESQEVGTLCGLPESCKCPMQQTMQISSEHSINVFINKAAQRIYSYYDDDIVIHLITQSISNSSQCRTSKAKVMNEVSVLTWNIPPEKNISGGFFMHRVVFNGFITGVKFFNIHRRVYIVITKYYDPVLNIQNSNTLVLRMNEDKTAVEEIQQIHTSGAKILTLFPTAQGIVLVLGSIEDDSKKTQVFRFNYSKQKFELLRELPTFGSLFAEGVILEKESLIILVNEYSTLLVLKYWQEFSNYYLYQSFEINYPVASTSVFYSEGIGKNDVYLNIVTTNNEYYIYSFKFIEGWKLKFSGALDSLNVLVPFMLHQQTYLLAPSNEGSLLLTFVEHDSE